jgi:hypothetical protein
MGETTGETTLREVPLRRFSTIRVGGLIWVIGAATLAAPTPAALVVGWIILADGALFVLLGLRRAFPGNYVRVSADGFASRSWRWRREVFIGWSEAVAVTVVEVGLGRDGYRYPDIRLAEGQHAPLHMLSSGLVPTRPLPAFFLRGRPYDRNFAAKVTTLREALEEFRARRATS